MYTMMIRGAGLLVLLILGASLASATTDPCDNTPASDFAGSVVEQTKQDDVIGVTSCRIPCKLKYNGVKNSIISSNSFRVSWTFSPRSLQNNNSHSVTDTGYWMRKYDLSMSVLDPQCKVNTTALHSNLCEPAQLDCGLTIASCSDRKNEPFDGYYICRVQHRRTGAIFEVRSELLHTGRRTISDYEPNCYHPAAVNVTAAEESINSTQMITVHWNSTNRPEGIEYCHGSRRYSVFVITFERADLDDHMDNGPAMLLPRIWYTNTTRARDTHFTIPPPISRDKYYTVQIQNRYKNTLGDYVYNQFTSPIFYFGEQRSPYFLESGDETVTVVEGASVLIECPAGGSPPPEVLLIRDGRQIGVLTETGYLLNQVLVEDVGDYYCSASSNQVNPPYLKRRLTVNKKVTIKLAVNVDPNPNAKPEPCQPYNTGTCGNYIYEDTKVLVNNSAALLESIILDQNELIGIYSASHHSNRATPRYMAAGVTEATIDQCYNFIRAIACNGVYPYCDASSTISDPVPRPLCKHTCDILRDEGACSFFLDPSFLEDFRYELPSLRDALFAKCDTRTAPGGESPECIYVSLYSPAVAYPDDELLEQVECVKGDGRSYAGPLSRTVSGSPCQSWYSQSPNTHSIVPAHFQTELYGARFSCRNPGGLGERPWCYTARETGRWEYCNPPQCYTCERYGGQFCSSLSGYTERSVYLNREGWSSVSLGDIEGSMVGLYHSLGGNGLSPACQNALTLLICHGSLPFCKDEGSPSPLPSCMDHCTLVDEMRLVCPVKVLSELTSRWSSSHRLLQLMGPDCSKSSHEQCMPSPTTITTSQAISKCYNSSDYGQSYGGTHSHTVSNLPCMDWSDTNTSFTAAQYPELVGANNTCRNPGQWAKAPWCFNQHGLVEPCLVQSCSTHVVDTKSPTSSNTASVVAPIVLSFGLIFAVGLAAAVVGFMVYRHKKQTTASSPQLQVIGNDSVKNVKFRDNNQYPRIQLLSPKVATAIASFKQVPKSNIEYVKQLGQGFFGMVFKGKLKSMDPQEPDIHVAVKTLKEDSNDGIEAFVNEAKLMFGFDHDNIVKILAVSMTQSPYYLVFEYMDKGDLAKFLRENASSLQRRYMNPLDRPRSRTESTLSDDPASLDQEQLTDICKQIVEGMEYLSVMNYVHRDLACRNCLVSSISKSNECCDTPSRVLVKIGDFGLSHNLYSKDYYRVRGQAVLPIRWMSPEAIIYGKFSTAGDVWSFGVVMWEVFTLGMQPYYGTSNEEVMERVRHGKVLQKPSDCSGRIYALMNECWTQDDQSRPSFTELRQCLEECRVSTSSEYDAQSMYSDISSDAFLEENSDPETEIAN